MQPAQRFLLRIVGSVMLALSVLLAWKSHWFHADRDLSRYPHLQLAYATAQFERVTHYRGSITKQIVLVARDGTRYEMEDGVWKSRFDGPALASRLSGGGTVHAWVHPEYPRTLRGITGGAVDIPPEWGLAYDQRNMHLGVWVDGVMAIVGAALIGWPLGKVRVLRVIRG